MSAGKLVFSDFQQQASILKSDLALIFLRLRRTRGKQNITKPLSRLMTKTKQQNQAYLIRHKTFKANFKAYYIKLHQRVANTVSLRNFLLLNILVGKIS